MPHMAQHPVDGRPRNSKDFQGFSDASCGGHVTTHSRKKIRRIKLCQISNIE